MSIFLHCMLFHSTYILMVSSGMFSEVKGIFTLEVWVGVYRAVTDTSKNVKSNDKLLQNPKRESQNWGKNFCGRRGREIAEAQYWDLLSYFSEKGLWLLLQEDLKRERSSFTFGFPRSLSSQECWHAYENTDCISLKIWSCNSGKDVNTVVRMWMALWQLMVYF